QLVHLKTEYRLIEKEDFTEEIIEVEVNLGRRVLKMIAREKDDASYKKTEIANRFKMEMIAILELKNKIIRQYLIEKLERKIIKQYRKKRLEKQKKKESKKKAEEESLYNMEEIRRRIL
ncbi:7755_t:CDS:2, partial [Cetraspora pellucida]